MTRDISSRLYPFMIPPRSWNFWEVNTNDYNDDDGDTVSVDGDEEEAKNLKCELLNLAVSYETLPKDQPSSSTCYHKYYGQAR